MKCDKGSMTNVELKQLCFLQPPVMHELFCNLLDRLGFTFCPFSSHEINGAAVLFFFSLVKISNDLFQLSRDFTEQ